MVELTELRTLSYKILREDEDVSNYPYALLDSFLNSAELDFCSGTIKNHITGAIIKKGKLPFLQQDYFYKNIAPITLSVSTTVGATVLTVSDTTNYPTSGKIYIAGNIISYTNKTTNTFTGCSNVLYGFDSGMQISPVFDLPANFMSPIQIIYNNKIKLPAQNYDEVYENLKGLKGGLSTDYNNLSPFTSGFRTNPFYTIKDGTQLILWNLNDAGIIHLRYEKLPSGMTLPTDTATIDNDTYARNILPQYAVGTMLFYRGEEQRAGEILNFAIGLTQQAYNYYENIGYETQSGIRYSVGKSGKRLNI